LDLNIPTAILQPIWKHIQSTRDQLIVAHGAPVVAGLGDGNSQRPTVQQPAVDWKGKLQHCFGKSIGASITKDMLHYETSEVETGEKTKGFVSILTVSLPHFNESFQGQTPCKSKKDAEKDVALLVLQQQFPQVFQQLTQEPAMQMVTHAMGQTMAGQPGEHSKKRKAESLEEPDAKNRLMRSLSLLLGRCQTKADVAFDTQTFTLEGKPTFVSTLKLPTYDATTAWTGESCASIKLAEFSACEVALDALADTIAPLAEEHAEKKKMKNREALSILKERVKEKREAQKAAQA